MEVRHSLAYIPTREFPLNFNPVFPTLPRYTNRVFDALKR